MSVLDELLMVHQLQGNCSPFWKGFSASELELNSDFTPSIRIVLSSWFGSKTTKDVGVDVRRQEHAQDIISQSLPSQDSPSPSCTARTG